MVQKGVFHHTYHNGKYDCQEGGLEDPEHSQTCNLDQSEQVYPSERNMTQVGEVRLVLGRHHVQLYPVPELWKAMTTRGLRGRNLC